MPPRLLESRTDWAGDSRRARRERNPIFSGSNPKFSPDEAKMKLNIPSLPSSTFAPYRGRLFYSCNARNPGEQQEEERWRRRLPTGNGSTNAAGNNILPCE